MSNTRTAKPGAPLRQERYASSYERGLLGNLVAKRAERLAPEQRAPIWFLQWLSWQPGALTEAQRAIGSDELERLCLDPDFLPADLLQAVSGYRAQWLAALPPVVQTTVGFRIENAIAFAKKARALVLLDGPARIGKSFAAQDCCRRSAGTIRYIQTPASNDEFSFVRAFALSLGVSSSLKMKAQEIRARVEETLQAGHLAVVLDEAHYCFDSYLRSTSLPMRINWLMCALVNYGVPLILVTTPQFHKAVVRLEKSTSWTSEQLHGRITYSEQLPEKLPMSDLLAVARSVFPEGNTASWRAMAAYADLSKTHLAAITALASRSRWHAEQSGRPVATVDDLRLALRESCAPVILGTPARKPRATVPPIRRDTGAGLRRVSDEMISTWRGESLTQPGG